MENADCFSAGFYVLSFYTSFVVHCLKVISEGYVNSPLTSVFSQQRVNTAIILESLKPSPVETSVGIVRIFKFFFNIPCLFEQKVGYTYIYTFLLYSDHPAKHCSSDYCGSHHDSPGTIC